MHNKLNVYVKKLSEKATMPGYAKLGDAGLDLFTLENTVIKAHSTVVIKTGIAMEIPRGYEMTIRPRSGISLKGCMVMLANGDDFAPVNVKLGTIDCGYRGDIGIITENQNDFDIMVYAGTKLAQGVISPIEEANLILTNELSTSDRGVGGFGSTGVHKDIQFVHSVMGKDYYIQKQLDIYTRKNADYGNSFERSMLKYGNVAYEVRAEDKLNRLSTLLAGNIAQVDDEKLEDTLDDLFNYTAMHLCVGHEKMTAESVREAMYYLMTTKPVYEFILEYNLTDDMRVLEEVKNYFGIIADN